LGKVNLVERVDRLELDDETLLDDQVTRATPTDIPSKTTGTRTSD
jgi:hypothetical protein